MVEKAGLAFDYVAVNPAHVDTVPVLAAKFPTLKIVVDHFAKPDIAGKTWEPWASQMSTLAKHKNVYMKFSGLNTASAPGWSVADWQPYVDHVVKEFGANRTLLGGDWPVIVLMNNYVEVWKAQLEAISKYSAEDQEWITHKTAELVYGI
jgi:L-fuconolactonase